MRCSVFWAVALLFSKFVWIDSAKILVMIPYFSKSHTICYERLYYALAARGHNITIITNHITSNPPPNVRYFESIEGSSVRGIKPFELRLQGKILNVFDQPKLFERVCHSMYQKPEIMDLVKEDFDLIILNSFANEISYGLASQFPNAKIMMFTIIPLISWISSIFGNPVIPSFTPMYYVGYTDKMSYSERVYNFLGTLHHYYYRNYVHVPNIENAYRTYFPNAQSVEEMERKVDIILINSHPITNYPRALLPNMIEVSGVQCRPGEPLPKDLQDFINGAGDDGFILFAMGSFLQVEDMPERFRLSFVNAFSKLKQRVIWKYEGEGMEDVPPNVKLIKWLPQQDVLAQPSLRLFITHGGSLSLQEALYHGVPLLGIPIFADQDGNLEQAYQNGYSLTLNLNEVTEELVTQKVNQILSDSNFKQNALELSRTYRDQPMPPLETAVFWTEFLLRNRRNRSTSYLHSAGRDLNAIQYHSLDVIGALFLVVLATLVVIFHLLRFILKVFRKFRSSNNLGNVKKTKKIKTK